MTFSIRDAIWNGGVLPPGVSRSFAMGYNRRGPRIRVAELPTEYRELDIFTRQEMAKNAFAGYIFLKRDTLDGRNRVRTGLRTQWTALERKAKGNQQLLQEIARRRQALNRDAEADREATLRLREKGLTARAKRAKVSSSREAKA